MHLKARSRLTTHGFLSFLFFIGAAVLHSPASLAAIKITSVQNASNATDLDGTTPTIWGGVAGSDSAGTGTGGCGAGDRSDDSTCNNCESSDSTDVSRFTACNNVRIFSELKLRITFTSDSTDGYPLITNEDGTTALLQVNNPSAVSKGSQASVVVRWRYICEVLKEGDQSGTIDCDPQTSQLAGTLKVGISKDSDSTLADGDDAKSISFKVHEAMESLQAACQADDPSAVEGLCTFDTNPGDEKVTLKELTFSPNFPLSTSISFKYVRVYASPVSFDDIDPNSSYVDLEVTGNDTTSVTLISDKVDGLENEQKYYFKAALVDEAGNVGYFTDDAQDVDCGLQSPPGTAPCHTAVPGKVVGVLEKDLNCFVATAAYGSQMASQVNTFRHFRNLYLLPNVYGRAFVKAYYKFGPKLAHFIAKSNFRRAAARVALLPALGFVWVAVKFNVWTAVLLALAILATPLITLKMYRRGRPS